MEASEKLNNLLLYLKISANKLSTEIGIEQNTTIYNLKKNKHDFSEDIARKITVRYPEISYKWLLTGEGEMLNTSQSNSKGIINNNIQAKNIKQSGSVNNSEFVDYLKEQIKEKDGQINKLLNLLSKQ